MLTVSDVYHRGMKCKFLLPYSPDLNPIKLAFLTMKYHLHQNDGYVWMVMTEMSDEEIHLMLLKALYIILPQDSYSWYGHCGYIWVNVVICIPMICLYHYILNYMHFILHYYDIYSNMTMSTLTSIYWLFENTCFHSLRGSISSFAYSMIKIAVPTSISSHSCKSLSWI